MSRFVFPTIGTSADSKATLFAIDDHSLPLRKNLCYYIPKPKVRPEPVLLPSRDNPDAPDYVGTHFYGTVLLEEHTHSETSLAFSSPGFQLGSPFWDTHLPQWLCVHPDTCTRQHGWDLQSCLVRALAML